MYKYIFLLPLYNDWESFLLLIEKISMEMSYLKKNAEILVVNDLSTVKTPQFKKYDNINKIKILNLKENLGSQKAISIGLNYLNQNKDENSIITILDSDGEDDVSKIPNMIECAKKNEGKVVVSSRTKRQENFLFKLAYFSHKILTLLFTLKWISYGNFSSFSSKQLKNILKNDSSWLAISSCIAKNCEIIKINAERKKRLIGISKLSIIGLASHSLRVNAVFLKRVIVLSIFYTVLIINLNSFIAIYFLILVIVFNFLVIVIFMKNYQNKFFNYNNLIDTIIDD